MVVRQRFGNQRAIYLEQQCEAGRSTVASDAARRIDTGERAVAVEDVAHSLGRSANEVQ